MKVTPKVVDDLYRFLAWETGRKPAFVLRFHTVLRTAFSQAVRWEWIERNPIERATPPSVQRAEPMPPEVVDVVRVLERAATSKSPDHALVFRLLAATGCRRGEVSALKWCDFQLDGPRPRVMIRRAVLDIQRQRIVQDTKTHPIRLVGLDEGTVELVWQDRARMAELGEAAGVALEPEDFIFPKSPGSKDRCRRTRSDKHGAAFARSSASTLDCTTFTTCRPRSSSTQARRSRRSPPGLATGTRLRRCGSTATSCREQISERQESSVTRSRGRPSQWRAQRQSHEREAQSADARLGTSLDAIDQT